MAFVVFTNIQLLQGWFQTFHQGGEGVSLGNGSKVKVGGEGRMKSV